MCRLHASHCRHVVNKGCRLSPSTSLSSLWFLLLAYIAPVVGIYRTRRLGYLLLTYICCLHTSHASTFNTLGGFSEQTFKKHRREVPGFV